MTEENKKDKLLRSKGQEKSRTLSKIKPLKKRKKDYYYKITKANEEISNIGRDLISLMPDEEYKLLGSKSGTLHFKRLLGLQSKITKEKATPVGIELVSDEDIIVPEIDVSKNNKTGIDPNEDITYRDIKAGEKFHLTYYEFLYLIIRDEYGGFLEAGDDEYGAHLSVKSPAYMRGDKKLPTPTIQYREVGKGSIKNTIKIIDEIGPDGFWRVQQEYKKFDKLVPKKKAKIRTDKQTSEHSYSESKLVAIALQEELTSKGERKSFSEEELCNRGKEIIMSMSNTRKENFESKSDTLHIVNELGFTNNKMIERTSKIGVTLISDIGIQVPVIDINLNNKTGINANTDITYRSVVAGEQFDLSMYEFMYLIIKDEYAGCCLVHDSDVKAEFTPNLIQYMKNRVETRLPSPRITVDNKHKQLSITDIHFREEGVLSIKPEYIEKFGSLLLFEIEGDI